MRFGPAPDVDDSVVTLMRTWRAILPVVRTWPAPLPVDSVKMSAAAGAAASESVPSSLCLDVTALVEPAVVIV